MTLAALISDLNARDVSLRVENGRLRVEGPAEMLTETMLGGLAGRKAELLRYLGSPGSGLLAVVRHEHRCRCGMQFKCTAPTCVGKTIRCICCKLDDFEAQRGSRSRGRQGRGPI